MKSRISITLDKKLLIEIDKSRGMVKRSNYIEHLIIGKGQKFKGLKFPKIKRRK